MTWIISGPEILNIFSKNLQSEIIYSRTGWRRTRLLMFVDRLSHVGLDLCRPGGNVCVGAGVPAAIFNQPRQPQLREGNSIRDGEKSERKGEKEKEGRDAPSHHPWMIWKPEEQKNRSRWPRCPLSFALAPPEKLPLKHMFQQKKAREQRRTHAWNTRRRADIPCQPLKGAAFYLESGWGDCMLSSPMMLSDIYNMRYLIFPYFNLGIRKEGFLLSQGHQAKAKKKTKTNKVIARQWITAG